ncbi:hypothetical protein [Luteolibacter sp. AS25]|uniref:hypothetical protein n=1 Tax=Luteolibacter sp. AS25 TaxID=3135776 RepID=UPI00398B51B1
MIKDDLIFDWDTKDFHRGRKIASLAVALLLFVVCFAALQVTLPVGPERVTKTASMIEIPNNDFGKIWKMRAEEEGPFPGGSDMEDRDIVSEMLESALSDADTGWGSYQLKPRELEDGKEVHRESYARKGTRFFPERIGQGDSSDRGKIKAAQYTKVPVLTPFNVESEGWMPSELPEYNYPVSGTTNFSLWRFMLGVRADGSVEHCIALGGEDQEVVADTVAWFRRVKFAPSEDVERWIGLSLEFENMPKDGN